MCLPGREDLGGLDPLVSEPEGDDSGVDAVGEQRHGAGVSQAVRAGRVRAQCRFFRVTWV